MGSWGFAKETTIETGNERFLRLLYRLQNRRTVAEMNGGFGEDVCALLFFFHSLPTVRTGKCRRREGRLAGSLLALILHPFYFTPPSPTRPPVQGKPHKKRKKERKRKAEEGEKTTTTSWLCNLPKPFTQPNNSVAALCFSSII